MLSAAALQNLPEVLPGDDLGELIAHAASPLGTPQDGDVLVVAHKVVSKSEGRVRLLGDVKPSERAVQLAQALRKDPRHVQVVLEESAEVLRAERGVLICVTHHGLVCANAGVDASNVPGEDAVLMLPRDPDGSARTLRARVAQLLGAWPAVLITDSFGRAWRNGQTDVAIGAAGLHPLDDWRGRRDAHGRELQASWIAVADELAGAADLTRTKDGLQPVVLVRGCERHVLAEDGPGARALRRAASEDLFR